MKLMRLMDAVIDLCCFEVGVCWEVSVSVLNLMQSATGSQCRRHSNGVMWQNLEKLMWPLGVIDWLVCWLVKWLVDVIGWLIGGCDWCHFHSLIDTQRKITAGKHFAWLWVCFIFLILTLNITVCLYFPIRGRRGTRGRRSHQTRGWRWENFTP